MANSTVKTRIQLKSDTESNWNKALHFIPLKGEVIIYTADDTHPFSRLKIGDGTTYINDLPFLEQNATIKSGTTEYWNSQIDFIPAFGEPIIYINNNENSHIKIGDGKTYLIDLPFLDEELTTKIDNHINNNIRHITNAERLFWNNKINCSDNIISETLILDRN